MSDDNVESFRGPLLQFDVVGEEHDCVQIQIPRFLLLFEDGTVQL